MTSRDFRTGRTIGRGLALLAALLVAAMPALMGNGMAHGGAAADRGKRALLAAEPDPMVRAVIAAAPICAAHSDHGPPADMPRCPACVIVDGFVAPAPAAQSFAIATPRRPVDCVAPILPPARAVVRSGLPRAPPVVL